MPAKLWRPALAATAALLAVVAQSHFSWTEPAARSESYVPRPEAAKLLAFGQEALLSDLYWLKAVQILGGSVHLDEHLPTLGRLIDVATRLDPWIDHPYRFAGVWLTKDLDQVRLSNEIMRRGVAYHPKDWRNRFYLSFNHFFYLQEEAAAVVELEPAVHLPGAPRYLGRLVARLRSVNGDLDAAAIYLHAQVENAPDPYRRAEYEKALDEIETERRARFLDAAREQYRERYGRDIARVEDLVDGKILSALPPEPHGWEWVLDDDSPDIVSSYLWRRYELNFSPGERERRESWYEDEEDGNSR